MRFTHALSFVFSVSLLAQVAWGQGGEDPGAGAVSGQDPTELWNQPRASTGYEGGRGLITLNGVAGMFINPTSGTMPEKSVTLQYCISSPNNDFDIFGHGIMFSAAIANELEVGFSALYLDPDPSRSPSGMGPGDLGSVGPHARYRITKDDPDGYMPQISVGTHSLLVGDKILQSINSYAAAYKRFPINDDGFFRAAGLHLGASLADLDDKAEFLPYGGAELQMPLRIYAVAELSTPKDAHTETPYALGLQWRAAGIAMSLAGIQNGTNDELSFYYGIGGGWSF